MATFSILLFPYTFGFLYTDYSMSLGPQVFTLIRNSVRRFLPQSVPRSVGPCFRMARIYVTVKIPQMLLSTDTTKSRNENFFISHHFYRMMFSFTYTGYFPLYLRIWFSIFQSTKSRYLDNSYSMTR